jgi:hypothetical protein
MQKFVTALNAISSQPWAICILLIGCGMLIACKKWGVDTTIAGGIIGIAGNMLTSTVSKTHTGDGQATQQDVSTPGATSPKI